MESQPDLKKIFLGIVVGTVVIAGILYAGFLYSQKQGLKLTLPGGNTYLGQQPSTFKTETPPTAPLRFTAATDTPWVVFKGKNHPYSFSYPQTLTLGSFPNDSTDAVAIVWGNIPPQNNLLLNIESIKNRDPQYVGQPEQFVRNWWRAFSGLKGVVSVDKFTTTTGLKGYKAIFTNSAGQSPNVDVFLEIPQDQENLIHLANGILDPAIFNRLIDSVKWTLTPIASPTASQ